MDLPILMSRLQQYAALLPHDPELPRLDGHQDLAAPQLGELRKSSSRGVPAPDPGEAHLHLEGALLEANVGLQTLLHLRLRLSAAEYLSILCGQRHRSLFDDVHESRGFVCKAKTEGDPISTVAVEGRWFEKNFRPFRAVPPQRGLDGQVLAAAGVRLQVTQLDTFHVGLFLWTRPLGKKDHASDQAGDRPSPKAMDPYRGLVLQPGALLPVRLPSRPVLDDVQSVRRKR